MDTELKNAVRAADEKLNIIGTEYDIPLEENLRKDVSVMCKAAG